MPAGDWHPDSRVRHTTAHIQLTTDGEVHHVGASYVVTSPSGTPLKDTAYSWPIPTATRKKLEAIMGELSKAIVEHEGVAGIDFRSFPEHTPERQTVDTAEGRV